MISPIIAKSNFKSGVVVLGVWLCVDVCVGVGDDVGVEVVKGVAVIRGVVVSGGEVVGTSDCVGEGVGDGSGFAVTGVVVIGVVLAGVALTGVGVGVGVVSEALLPPSLVAFGVVPR